MTKVIDNDTASSSLSSAVSLQRLGLRMLSAGGLLPHKNLALLLTILLIRSEIGMGIVLAPSPPSISLRRQLCCCMASSLHAENQFLAMQLESVEVQPSVQPELAESNDFLALHTQVCPGKRRLSIRSGLSTTSSDVCQQCSLEFIIVEPRCLRQKRALQITSRLAIKTLNTEDTQPSGGNQR